MQLPEQAIENYLAGTANAAEKQLVSDWYYSFNDEEVEIPANLKALREQIYERIHNRLQQSIRSTATPVIKINYKKKWLAAAAVFTGMLATGTYVFVHNKSIQPPVAVVKNIPVNKAILPGGNKAVLTLADGSEIILDSAQNGTLTQQGNSKVIKLDNGQLAYKMNGSSDGAVSYNTISTPRGGQYQITLPDGTMVWLNSASSLKFPTAFTGSNREVLLNGEGYFEVTHVSSAAVQKVPFTVSVNPSSAGGGMKVTVMGTRFNIMAYKDEDAVKTTLVEGSVAASNNTGKVIIKPGQQAGIKNNASQFKVADADIKEVLAWKNGEFRFKEMNIKTIMRQLERWYDVNVEYSGDLTGITLSGVVPKKDDISQLLDVLETTGKVHFEIKGRNVTAMPN